MQVNNFTVLESIHGRFIVNRHCYFQIDHLAKLGTTHIENELNAIFQLIKRLPDESTIIDGGANIGFFAIPVAQKVKNRGMNVVAFEPQKMLFSALSGTVALNDLSNVWVKNYALSDEPGLVQLSDFDYNKEMDYGMVTVSKEGKVKEHPSLRSITVEAVTIDSFDFPDVGFIKLDVEGFECEAIRGAEKTIKKHRPILWVEYFLIGQEKVAETLKAIDPNYDCHIADNQNMVCIPR